MRILALTPALVAMIAATALAQEDGTRDREEASGSEPAHRYRSMWLAPLSTEADADGPINTDRPSFTQANTVVPRGRLQVESGYTFTHNLTSTTRTQTHALPELAVRAGLTDRVEFRTFWQGQTESRETDRLREFTRDIDGPNDMEIGFKTQLIPEDKQHPWRPTTALITSIMAPTGGASPYSSRTVQPNLNLLYGWTLSPDLTLAGSTGYLGLRKPGSGRPADSFERFHQSLIAYYTVAPRTTLYYEWYAFTSTNAFDNRPTHSMDGGLLFRPTPNTQLDLRAGFGLGDRPDDFFAGAGFSVRY
jgi:hypothetical protein